MRTFFLIILLVTLGNCKVFNNCELSRTLINYGLPRHQIATWVCIAFKESSYNTQAINHSSNCYGLFQISQQYWCSPGAGCGLSCTNLIDDDISDDVKCVKTIFREFERIRGNGFLAWETYPHCADYNTARTYIEGCNI